MAVRTSRSGGITEHAHVYSARPDARTFDRVGHAPVLADPVPYGPVGVAYMRALTPLITGGDKTAASDQADVTSLGVSLGTIPARWAALSRWPVFALPHKTCAPRSPAIRTVTLRSRGSNLAAYDPCCVWRPGGSVTDSVVR
jgi:hypothetical protein